MKITVIVLRGSVKINFKLTLKTDFKMYRKIINYIWIFESIRTKIEYISKSTGSKIIF